MVSSLISFSLLLALVALFGPGVESGALGREKRWIQATGYGGKEPIERRAVGDKDFPKYPGENDVDFESEFDDLGQGGQGQKESFYTTEKPYYSTYPPYTKKYDEDQGRKYPTYDPNENEVDQGSSKYHKSLKWAKTAAKDVGNFFKNTFHKLKSKFYEGYRDGRADDYYVNQ